MSTKIIRSKYFFEEEYQESLATVPENSGDPLPEKSKLKYIGRPVSRIEGGEKVNGKAQYTYDIYFPDLLHACILRSPYANAKILNIDFSEAKKLAGVREVLTYKNTPDIGWYKNTSKLFDPHLRYAGDEVACVLAESEDIARRAVQKIKVDYKKLPHVTDVKNAMANEPTILSGSNRGKPNKYERGNFDSAYNSAPFRVEDYYTTQVAIHNPLEAHCSVAKWDKEQLTVWDSTQAIFRVRQAIAKSLGIPESNVRVIKKHMGGGFGSKLEAGKYAVMAALLAKKCGHPVRIALDRKEMNLAVGNRPDSRQTLRAATNKEGALTALSHYSIGSSGAYPAGAGCSWPLRSMYKCENIKTEEYSVLTNTGRARPFRAPGHVQGTFALEGLLDTLAEKVGIDPLEFRIKNHVTFEQTSGLPYTSKKLLQAYDVGAKAIGWKNRNPVPGKGRGPVKSGIGMASQIWWGGGGPPAYAQINLSKEGNIEVLSGTQDLGTGTYTIIAQTAAEILGYPLDKIKVVIGDTALTPYAPGSGGSVTAASVTPAVMDAAENLKKKILASAAVILNTPVSGLGYHFPFIEDPKNVKNKISIDSIARETNVGVLPATGHRNENPEGYAINSFGAQFAEVDVDTETGLIAVKKIVAAHDIGRTINPKTTENQFHGGIIQGLGFALLEERRIDQETGTVVNPNLHDYKVPTIHEVPEIELHIVSDYDNKISPMGVKGIGEPAIIPTAAAIANAVYNATGIRLHSLPMTPDKVLSAIQNGGN